MCRHRGLDNAPCMIFDIGRRRLRRGSLSCARAAAVAPEHSLGGFQFLELAGEPLSLCIDARERLGDPLLLLGDLVRHRHLYLQRKLSRETILRGANTRGPAPIAPAYT